MLELEIAASSAYFMAGEEMGVRGIMGAVLIVAATLLYDKTYE